jgi:hypothetical protein
MREHINKFNTFLKEGKFNNSSADENILEDFLFTFLVDYLSIDITDDIPYETFRYSTKKSHEDDKYEYYDIYLSEINIFQVLLNLDEGILELGKIIHRNHFMVLIKTNWDIVSNFQYEKMKLNLNK